MINDAFEYEIWKQEQDRKRSEPLRWDNDNPEWYRQEDKMKKTIGDIVREYFQDASDDFIEFVIWEKTGFPEFWNIPKDGNTPEECFRKQLLDFKNSYNSKTNYIDIAQEAFWAEDESCER